MIVISHFFGRLTLILYFIYRRHERVQDTDRKRGTTRERLSEVQLGVGVVVIVLVEELHVAVVDQFGDHGYVGAIH